MIKCFLIIFLFILNCSNVDNFIKDTNGKEHFYAHSPIFTESVQDSIELYCYYHQEYEKIFHKSVKVKQDSLKKWQSVANNYRIF
tara:strand:+ start:535 stop:789 length:255 start_codon:yes stop_codon:yes gene_type:complete